MLSTEPLKHSLRLPEVKVSTRTITKISEGFNLRYDETGFNLREGQRASR